MRRDLSTTSSTSSLLHPQKLAGPRRAAECQWRAPIGLRCPQLFTECLAETSSSSVTLEMQILPFSSTDSTVLIVVLNSCLVLSGISVSETA